VQDSGGILEAGWDAFWESRRRELDVAYDKTVGEFIRQWIAAEEAMKRGWIPFR